MNGLLPGETNDYTPATIMNTNHLMVETEDTFSSLLELAANNNIEGIKRWIDRDPSSIDEVGQWYGRQKGSKQMVLDHRTALMVAATYGSIDALILILSLPEVDVNRSCGRDKSTALHCAASGGSLHALDAIKLLLESGADPKLVDGNGYRPLDVVFVPPTFRSMKPSIQNLLNGLTVDSPLPDSTTSSSPESENLNPKKEYPVDPSLPDIKNGIFSTDEFRMFSFKIRPCSRAYSHDWTECPFVHPGENARRRDPRKYHYSCVPCPEFRKGACRRGDMCEYAHGVFECWLHPAQYRTRLCKDGTLCNRRVCFFAHAQEELRPLYISTGSGMGSPSSPFTPPMSPSNSSLSNMGWPMQNVPTLLLPGSNNFQSSRLRSSFHARDILGDQDFNRSGCSKAMTPSNLEDLFSAESSSSPRYSSPTHKSAVFNQFQQQQPSVLSPINTKFSPDNPSLLAASFGAPSPRIMDPISPLSSRVSLLARCEKQQQFRSLSSRDLGSSASSAWSKWGLPSEEKPDWAFNTEEFGGKLRRSSSFELANNNGGDEPDLSWVQSLVKESPQEMKAVAGSDENNSGKGSLNSQMEQIDQSTLHAWLEQMHLDQLMAQ